MNIIVPLCGSGERFRAAGYESSKPLLPVYEKPMILHVLDRLHINPAEHRVFVIHCGTLGDEFEPTVLQAHPAVRFVRLSGPTRGAAETVARGLPDILRQTPFERCVLLDCDTFYTENVLDLFSNVPTNAVFYTDVDNESTPPLFSYIQLLPDTQGDGHAGFVACVREKEAISRHANTGAYCFQHGSELLRYARHVVEQDLRFQGEFYTSCVIQAMLDDDHAFVGIPLPSHSVINLGTPAQLRAYLRDSFVFLFDLDGTLVLTDDIYVRVWSDLLAEYRISVDETLFRTYIQGHSDANVLRQLLPHGQLDQPLDAFSKRKDQLFLQHLDALSLVPGASSLLATLRSHGHRVGVVTNCNRLVAEHLLLRAGLQPFVDYLVIGPECDRAKPFPDPYLRAIQLFRTTHEKVIIFEDSKTGIQSAKNTFPKCLVGVETVYRADELRRHGVDVSVPDFCQVDLAVLLQTENRGIDHLVDCIRHSFPQHDIRSVQLSPTKLKGGFISDVVAVHIETRDASLNCVLKLENKEPTFLSRMATELDLYEREYYFYESLSAYVPLQLPKFHGLVKDRAFRNVGVLMENLAARKGFRAGLDLNAEPIEVSLRIVDRIATLHARFWNKDLQTRFSGIKRHNDPRVRLQWFEFVQSRWPLFHQRWQRTLSADQLALGEDIAQRFADIQQAMSTGHLTLCHGDVKSANIFYRPGDNEPYFIDWQYVCEGKGVQDLVFFLVESFDKDTMDRHRNLLKEYYFVKLHEHGVTDYDRVDFERDFRDAAQFFPFFVAVWFGTVDEDELIDKNFPFFFIQKLFHFLSCM